MINLENKCVIVKTLEEYMKIMEEAEKQGFKCMGYREATSLIDSNCSYILKFYKDKTVNRQTYDSLLEASELLETKEQTAREFIEHMVKVSDCEGRKCENCILNFKNTKCKKSLCNTREWKNNDAEELISIVNSGKTTIKSEREKAIETLEQFISDFNEDNIKNTIRFTINFLKEEGK